MFISVTWHKFMFFPLLPTVASVVEEGANLASDSALEIMVDMAKAKVGGSLNAKDVKRIKSIMMSEPSPIETFNEGSRNPPIVQSGITDHGAEMLSQMMSNLGPDVSPMEVIIVSDMIKELDKDISKETAEVMAEVLKQVEEVTPEVVHNISAVVSNEEPTLGMN